MDKKKLLFIFNPHSGKGQIRMQLVSIVDTFVKNGYEVTIYPTQEKEDAVHKVEEQAEEYDLVVCRCDVMASFPSVIFRREVPMILPSL